MSGLLTISFIALASVPTPATGEVGGRVSFVEGGKPLTAGQVRQRLSGQALRLELRPVDGVHVLEAVPDDAGLFVVKAPAGRYQAQYLVVGTRAEFFPLQELVVSPGTLSCVGTLRFTSRDVAKELGENVSGKLDVVDDCASMSASLQGRSPSRLSASTAVARPARPRDPPSTLDWVEVLIGLRAQVAFTSGYGGGYGGAYVFAFGGSLDDVNNPLAIASVLFRTPTTGGGGGGTLVALGGGYEFTGVEVHLGGSYLTGPAGASGPGLWGELRLGGIFGGLGGRADVTFAGGQAPLTTLSLTIDVAPFYVVGSLL